MKKLGPFLLSLILITGCGEKEKISYCEPEDLIAIINSLPSDGGTVKIEQIQNISDFEFIPPEEGGSFMGKNGDYLMENDKIHAIVQQPSRQISPAPYGGNLIDADIKRSDGVWHDVMGEISTFLGISYTMDAENFEVLRDGSDGVGVLRVSGKATILDYINIDSAVSSIASSIFPSVKLELPWDLNAGIPFYVSNYYVLRAGDSHIKTYTALCNTSGDNTVITLGDIIDSGGTVAYFNTSQIVNKLPGFGYTGDAVSDVQPAKLIGFMGEDSGYAILPDTDAWNIILAGVAVIHYGTSNGLDFLLKAITGGVSVDNPPAGYFPVQGKKSVWYSRDVIVFNNYSDMMEEYYKIKGISPSQVSGSVKLGVQGIKDARVAFINSEGELEVLFKTDENGNFSGAIAPGTYDVYADVVGWPEPQSQTITISEGENSTVDFNMEEPAYLSFNITGVDPNLGAQAVTQPAKVSLKCVGECPRTEKRMFYDTLYDKFPSGYQMQAFVDQKGLVYVMAKRGIWGEKKLPVPPGTYDLIISRGMEFETYTERITLSAGEEKTITAQIDRVVDTSGYISADLHVHSVNSPDAPVPLYDRVLTFMGEGVDILVSTDHDFITDYKPVINSLEASPYITSFSGEELTTFDVGHFNGYPLKVSTEEYQNGAVDWAGGRGPNLTPEEIFKSLKEKGAIDDPVVQVNHPRSIMMGYFTAIQLDTDTLKTHADPKKFRMDSSKLNITDDDTGLFSTLFDAFEIYNSYSDEITQVVNDYFTFLNIGLIKTGVAVSDTHHWYNSEAGSPRSFVYVGEGKDTPDTIDAETFARAIQNGKVIGTNGPFIHPYIKDNSGNTYYMGKDLIPYSNNLVLYAEIRMPEWISVDTIEVFSNTRNTASRNGEGITTWPEAEYVKHLTSGDFTTQKGQKTYFFSYPITTSTDSWYVIIVRDDPDYPQNYPMVPVLTNPKELPFAFTNAFLIDFDGNGQFDPPGATPLKSAIKKEEKTERRLIKKDELIQLMKKIGDIEH